MTDNLHQTMQTAGEHPVLLEGLMGKLEGRLIVPDNAISNTILFLGHPHSLQGGSMSNKVVTTMARAARDVGIPSLRFNFRGVGQSEGEFDNGIGESNDLIAIVDRLLQDNPAYQCLYAGFSFGSYVTYRAAASRPHKLLISIAPPVERYDYQAFKLGPWPWEIIMGDKDEVASFDKTRQFAKEHHPPIPLHCFDDTGHFFHGQLITLRQTLEPIFKRAIKQ